MGPKRDTTPPRAGKRKRKQTDTYDPVEEAKKPQWKHISPLKPSHDVAPPSPPPSTRWGLVSRLNREASRTDCPQCDALVAAGAKCDKCKDAQVHNPDALEGSRSVVANTAEMVVDGNPGLGSGAAVPPNINPFGSFGNAIAALGRRAVEAVLSLHANLRDSALALQTALDAHLSDEDVKAFDDVSEGSNSDDSQPNLDSDEEQLEKLDARYGGQYSMPQHDLDTIKAKIDAFETFSGFTTLTAEQRDELTDLKDLYEVGKASQDFVVPDDSSALKEKSSKKDWDDNGPMSKVMVRGPGGPMVAKKSSENPDKVLLPSRSLGNRNAPSPPPRHQNPYAVTERYKPTFLKEGPAPSTYFNPFTPLHSKDPRKWVLTVSDGGNFEGQDDFEFRCENRAEDWKLEESDDEQTWVCHKDLVFTIDEITKVVIDEAKNTKITQEEIDSMKSRLQAVGIEVSGGVIGLPDDEEGPEEISDLFLRIPVPSTGFHMQHYKVPEDEDADDEEADEMEQDEDADDAETDYLNLRFSLDVSPIVNDAVWIREVVNGSEHDSDSDHEGSVYSREAADSRSEGSADGDVSDIGAWEHSDSENEFQDYDQLIPGSDPPVYINADGYDAAGNYYPGALGWYPAPNNGAAAPVANGHPQGGSEDDEDSAPAGPRGV